MKMGDQLAYNDQVIKGDRYADQGAETGKSIQSCAFSTVTGEQQNQWQYSLRRGSCRIKQHTNGLSMLNGCRLSILAHSLVL